MAPPTTNAERCKRYRESHKEKYRENDALRKRHSRLIATLDPVRNAARKKRSVSAKKPTDKGKNTSSAWPLKRKMLQM